MTALPKTFPIQVSKRLLSVSTTNSHCRKWSSFRFFLALRDFSLIFYVPKRVHRVSLYILCNLTDAEISRKVISAEFLLVAPTEKTKLTQFSAPQKVKLALRSEKLHLLLTSLGFRKDAMCRHVCGAPN